MLIEPSDKLPNGKLKFIHDTPSKEFERIILEKLWARYQPYADANFKTAIASDFQSRFWEMYLAVTLLDLGFNLRRRLELGNEGPDISIQTENTNIWLEAIACGTIPDDFAESENGDPIDESVILRYTSVIAEKFNKYEKYLQEGILSDSEPYIIAINGSRVPFALQVDNRANIIPDIIKSVMSFGDYAIVVDQCTNQIVKSGYTHRPHIIKPSGKSVQTNIFLDQKYAGISAILYSNMDITGIPNEYGNDILIFHNPIAANPLPRGWLRVGYEYCLEGYILSKKDWKGPNVGSIGQRLHH